MQPWRPAAKAEATAEDVADDACDGVANVLGHLGRREQRVARGRVGDVGDALDERLDLRERVAEGEDVLGGRPVAARLRRGAEEHAEYARHLRGAGGVGDEPQRARVQPRARRHVHEAADDLALEVRDREAALLAPIVQVALRVSEDDQLDVRRAAIVRGHEHQPRGLRGRVLPLRRVEAGDELQHAGREAQRRELHAVRGHRGEPRE